MVDFEAKNMRSTEVELFKNGNSRGRVGAGASQRFSDAEGEVWAATPVGGAPLNDTIASYEVTPRVTTWTIAPAPTGEPVSLNPHDAGDYNESLTTKPIFLKAQGIIKAVMLFVDFPGDRASGQQWADEKKIEERVVGTAADWLKQESFGATEIQVTAIGGWKTLKKKAATYSDPECHCVSQHMETFIKDTVAEFPKIDFSQYQIVYIVAAPSDDFLLSPAFVGEQPISAPKGEVRFAVVFGRDSYTSNEFLLLHETCHLFGLPDLYDGGTSSNGGYSPASVGPWDLMADQITGRHLLGWHRLKLGWLKSSQAVCVYDRGELVIELAGWSDPQGVKLVMVPITMNPKSPDYFQMTSLAYVVEAAPPAGTVPSPGVLIYTVSAAVQTWQRPIQLRGGNDGLYASPVPVGGSFSHKSGNVRIEVLAAVRDGFRVRVSR